MKIEKSACFRFAFALLLAAVLTVPLWLVAPVSAAEACWANFTGWKCHTNCLPPPPGEVCASQYVNGQLVVYCQYVEEGNCQWTCDDF